MKKEKNQKTIKQIDRNNDTYLYFATSTDTRDPSISNPTKLFKRFNPTCNSGASCTISDAMACYNYLNSLGTNVCKVQGWSVFCTAGNCSWDGNAAGFSSSLWYVYISLFNNHFHFMSSCVDRY